MSFRGLSTKCQKPQKPLYWLLFVVVVLLLILPIAIVEIPPLIDLPNHAARVHILAQFDTTQHYRETFEIAYAPVPNVILDIVTVPLAQEFGVWIAIRAFLILTVLIFAFGCHLVGNINNPEFSVSPLIGAFFVYSSAFFYGYLNYVFSVSLFLVTFGLWLRWRYSHSRLRLLALMILSSLVYLSHLSSFGFLFLGIACIFVFDCFSSHPRRSLHSVGFDGLIFLLPCLMFISYLGGDGAWRAIEWEGITSKLIALAGVIRSYDFTFDLVFSVVIALFFLAVFNAKNFEIDRPLFYVALFFLIIFIPSPSVFITGDADARIVMPALVLLVCSCRIPLSGLSGSCKSLVLGILLFSLLCSRQALISYRWTEMSDEIVRVSKLLNVLPANALIYPLYGKHVEETISKTQRPLLSVLSVATITNGAISPNLFAFRGQNPLFFRTPPEFASLSHIDEDRWVYLIPAYDYVWTYDIDAESTTKLAEQADLVVQDGKAGIWKMRSR